MKSRFFSGVLLVAAAAAFASCSQDSAETVSPELPQFSVTLSAGNPSIAPDAQPQSTRTEMEGTTPYWSVGDQIGVSTDGTSNNVAFTNDASERARTTTFSGTISAGTTLYTYYPYTANGISGSGDQAGARVDLPANQTPTATSFDGRADLLIGQPLAMTADGTVVGNLQFKRVSAIVKVVLKDNSTAKSLTGQHISMLSLAAGGENWLAGRLTLNLVSGQLLEPSYGQSNKVTAAYTSATQYEPDGTSGTYLSVYPRELPAGSTLTFEAATEGFSISRTVTLAEPVALLPGKINTLTVSLADEHITAAAAGFALPFTDDFSWITTTSNTVLPIDGYPKAEDGTARYSATANTYPETPALKFGTANARGSFTTADLDLSQPFTVLVKARDYGTDGSGLTVTAGEAASQNVALTGSYKYYAFEFPAQGSKSKVRVDITGKRGYLLDFQVVAGHDVPLPPELTVTSETTVTASPDGERITTTYTVENPVAGASVTADAGDASWINTFETSVEGQVSYTVDANDTGEERSATVTFAYADAKPQTVTVTQPKQGAIASFNSGIFTSANNTGLSGSWDSFQSGRGIRLTTSKGSASWVKSDFTTAIKTVTIYASNNASAGSGAATVSVTDEQGVTTNLLCGLAESATITGCKTVSTAFVFSVPAEDLFGTIQVNVTASANSVYFEYVVVNE
ncbi:BACON domain-containing protein [Alistipes sp.]|uniref:BACON domain-containing protein n=1 Tax=Alistipes sp. TaxID=1872444 RepID=UPI003AB23ECD